MILYETYQCLVENAEMLQDIRDYDEAKKAIESGEELIPCQPTTLPSTKLAEIDAVLWTQIRDVWTNQDEPIDDPRALARFACGITSPRLTRAGLSRHPLFGSLGDVKFGDVHRRAQTVETRSKPVSP